jgi:hypothetical protein
MGPEWVLLIAGALGIGGAGALWWARRGQRDHVIRVRTAWVRAGQIVHYGPVGAVCLGRRPQRLYRAGRFGALGITDGHLVFEGHRRDTENLSVPLANLRHIGLTTVRVWIGRTAIRQRALAVHYTAPDGWRVATFAAEETLELAQALSDESDLLVYDSGKAREDFGPARALRMTQDVYGEWREDREGDLYLAPDRLLFNWRETILLDDIRRLDVYAQGGRLRGLNPLAQDLLRVEYGEADETVEIVGYVVRGATRWADAIRQHAAAPLDVYAGRKRKSGD